MSTAGLQQGSDSRGGVRRTHDRVHFEVDDVAPACDPFVQKETVIRLHELITASETGIYPAGHVSEPRRCEPSVISEASVHWYGIASLESFDHHIQRRGHHSILKRHGRGNIPTRMQIGRGDDHTSPVAIASN